MEYFGWISKRKTNVPYKKIFKDIVNATGYVSIILERANNEQMRICCHILTSIARLECAILQDNVKEIYAEMFTLKKRLDEAFFSCYASQDVI